MASRGVPPARVVVTGIGAVSAAGWGAEPLWEVLLAGSTAIGSFDRFDHSRQRSHVAGQVPAGPSPEYRRPASWARLSYSDRFALFAAEEAVSQAGLAAPLQDAGCYLGSSTAGLFESEAFVREIFHDSGRRGRLWLMASHQLNGPGDAVARHLGVTGPVETHSSACASSALAIEAAFRALRDGEVDLAIAGGADSLCAVTYSGFNALRAVDPEPCRPFRQGRNGTSLGEGAGILVMECLNNALARGAQPLAELLGVGSSCDANHMTAPHPEGLGAASAMSRAIEDAGLAPDQVEHVNAHGTGTPLNDASEWAALVATFGARASAMPVTATKSIVGHLLGSSGALEAVATVLCLRARRAHPTAGDGDLDQTLDIDLVRAESRALDGRSPAISTSLGFGGANAALVLGPWSAA
jgi:3-oxoacyl-[acyl-carrier-protein] synthase II